MSITKPMTSVKRLPSIADSRPLLSMLFGSDTVCNLRRNAIPTEECVVVAIYTDNDGAVKRLLACDLAFANSAGASLSAIPPQAALSATKARRIADNVVENLNEVMNIAVNLLIESFGARLELASVTRVSDLAPDTLAALKSDQRLKLDISIPRYELGRVDLIAV